MSKFKRTVKSLSAAIDRGADSAERIHLEVAGMPFQLFERLHVLEEPANEVRAVQDRTLRSLYRMVRNVNHKLASATGAAGAAASAGSRGNRRRPAAQKPRRKQAKAPARKSAKTSPKKSRKKA